jgi:nucleoside-diphosphate-sugar epimerase
VAAYGFHRDNPVGMDEDWPTRPAQRLFYAQEKAELEHLLQAESEEHPDLAVYLLRPSIVLGPHTIGGKQLLPGPLAPLGRLLGGRLRRLPVPLPAPVPDLPLQLVHEDDVGQALLQCVVGAGPPGAYNIAGDGVLSAVDVARELGIIPLPVPARAGQSVAGALARLPFLPSRAGWVEAASHPAVMDTSRAKERLGWAPRYTGLEALRDTIGR